MSSAMAFRTAINSRVPMVVILGATGTGKTKLSVELAQKFGAEVISADSMQVYRGLDIVTAKATQRERSLVAHHLLDLLEPHQHFTVVDFKSRALKIMNNLIEKNKIPIIVGGTNYYMESIIWNILVEEAEDTDRLLWDKDEDIRRKRHIDGPRQHEDDDAKKRNLGEEAKKDDVAATTSDVCTENIQVNKETLLQDYDNEAKFSNEELHKKLKTIDPVMAGRLHPNNRRKILRSIEVWLKTDRRHSDILAEQRLTEGRLRRPGATIVFWLKCEKKVHDVRLDARVDSMLEEGLVQELMDFHERHNKQRMKDGQPADYTKGVYQTLGFKEFHDYLMLGEEERTTEKGRTLLRYSVENMKMATRRYARRQNKMILSRFLQHPTREIPPIYDFDTSDINKWEENVKNKAIDIIENFITNTPSQFSPLTPTKHKETEAIDGNSPNFCEVCKRIIIGDKTYKIHMSSNKHKKMLSKIKRNT